MSVLRDDLQIIYLPDTGPARLGRAMFYAGWATCLKFLRDRGMYIGTPHAREVVECIATVELSWPRVYKLW